MLVGIPLEFWLFGATLLGVAFFHKWALQVALAGLAAIVAYQLATASLPAGPGLAGVARHFAHEWVILSNLLLLLVGFELLSNQFELSRLPDHLPRLLPGNWTSGIVLLGLVFLLSGILDNIAAAILGGVVARHVYAGKVSIALLVAIVAAANAGGAGSVIGDTTTTIMWLHGVSPLTVLPAYLAALAAFAVFGLVGAVAQHRSQPASLGAVAPPPLEWRRVVIVLVVLASAVAANIVANMLQEGEETAPWLGIALWLALLVTSSIARPHWSVMKPAARGAAFLLALVAAASLMPIKSLPEPSWQSAFLLGLLSSVFDNIPLTVLTLKQGGYDWALLAYAVGFGGSMLWFGSSAGVAITNLYPEARSVVRWVRAGWAVPIAYCVGFLVLLFVGGWHPTGVR